MKNENISSGDKERNKITIMMMQIQKFCGNKHTQLVPQTKFMRLK